MSGGSCQTCAKQANDAIAYRGGLPPGIVGATAEQLRGLGCGGGGRAKGRANKASRGARGATRSKKGCQKQGPGCANASCNKCADQAVAAIDYAAGFSDGLGHVSHADIQRVRLAGGFVAATGRLPAGWGGAPLSHPESALQRSVGADGGPNQVNHFPDCSSCEQDMDVLCASKWTGSGTDTRADPDADPVRYNAWWSTYSGCSNTLQCIDYTPLCDLECLELDKAHTETTGGLIARCGNVNGTQHSDEFDPVAEVTYDTATKTCRGVVKCGGGFDDAPVDVNPCLHAVAVSSGPIAVECEGTAGSGWDPYGDHGPAPTANCSIVVGAHSLHQVGDLASHLFIVLWDETGSGTRWEGGPDAMFHGWPHGALQMTRTDNVPPQGYSQQVRLDVANACSYLDCLHSESLRINSRGIAYWPLGPNSNSAAFSMLTNCHLPVDKPDVYTPGWGIPV